MEGCPLGIDIPGFIRHIRENEPRQALARIREKNMLSAICGRLCPAPCERACVFYEDGAPIAIRALERYAADYGQARLPARSSPVSQKKVAVVGSGPTGLSAAAHLAHLEYGVTIFESFPAPGGVLRQGVPEFRLPRKVLDSEIDFMESLGIEIKTNVLAGQTAGLGEILGLGYSAILLALGAGTPKFLDIPGTNLGGVYYAEEFLLQLNLLAGGRLFREEFPLPVGDRVVVVGGGYAALDCSRMARRLGKEAIVVFHRTQDEMEARIEEREYAREEGVRLEPLVNPIEILGDDRNWVAGLKCTRLDFANPQESGAWQLVPVPESEFVLEADTLIIAVGHQPNSAIIKKTPNLKVNPDGTIYTNPENRMTSMAGVFAAGPIARGPTSVVEAMAEGKKVAEQMDQYLKGRG